ncbi:MAG: NAD-dependent epimerase/dehydratase family protein [Bacteroidetes bacterium]|nr:NAD-dependent epimerase/dehydratase family protein [Bacteroidota bacterium]
MDLVTGGTGFLGAHLLYHLLNRGAEIRAIKRPDSDLDLLHRVFRFYKVSFEDLPGKIEWVNADLNDPYAMKECLYHIRDVYHVAGKVSFLPADREELIHVNVHGTANLVNLSIEQPIRKFCYVSSIAALGRGDLAKVIDEEVVWKISNRNSQYAISKYGGEREVWRGIEEGLNAVIVNPGIILGPGEISSGSARLIQTVENGLKFYTQGVNGFVDVRDVVNIMVRLMESNITAQRFVIAAENIDYKTLFGMIAEKLKKPPPKWPATRWMGTLAWLVYHLNYLITGKKPLITRETAMTASNFYRYSSEKIKHALNYSFIPILQTIDDTCSFHLYHNSIQES